jgi:hypothetical protein
MKVIKMKIIKIIFAVVMLSMVSGVTSIFAAGHDVVNVYTARHYASD